MIFSDLTDDIWNEGKHNTGIDAETCDLSKLNWQIKNLKMTYFSVSVNLNSRCCFDVICLVLPSFIYYDIFQSYVHFTYILGF